MNKPTYTIEELGEVLGLSKGTVYNRLATAPETLPRPLDVPSQRIKLWLVEDVVAWLRSYSPVQVVQGKRGRPTSAAASRPVQKA